MTRKIVSRRRPAARQLTLTNARAFIVRTAPYLDRPRVQLTLQAIDHAIDAKQGKA